MNSEAKSVPLQEVVNGICWSYRVLDDGTVEIVGKPSPRPAGDLEFPARLGGRPVTRIGDAVLHGCAELASVTVPEGVVVLGAEVFYGCTELETVVFPASLEETGSHAFCRCPKLREFRIADGNPVFVFYRGFLLRRDRRMLVRAVGQEGDVTVPAGVEEIADGAFSGCTGVTSVALPDGLRIIWDDVFEFCDNLTTMRIPGSLAAVGFDVFYGSPKLRTLRVQPGDAERIREVLEEWASAEVSFNYVFEES